MKKNMPSDGERAAVGRKQDKRLTDKYAAEARKDSHLPGDELSELEPVGRKDKEQRPPKPKPGSAPARVGKSDGSRVKLAGNRTSGTGRR